MVHCPHLTVVSSKKVIGLQDQSRHRLHLHTMDSCTIICLGSGGEGICHRCQHDLQHHHALFFDNNDTKLLNWRKKTMKNVEV